jgi:hypothetical protein
MNHGSRAARRLAPLSAAALALMGACAAMAQDQDKMAAACAQFRGLAQMTAADVRAHAGAPVNRGFSDERTSDLQLGGGPCTVSTGAATELTCVSQGDAGFYAEGAGLALQCLSSELTKSEKTADGAKTYLWLTGGVMLKVYPSGPDLTFKWVY